MTPGALAASSSRASTGTWTDYAPVAIKNDGTTGGIVFNAAVPGGSGYRVDQLGEISFSSAATISPSTASVLLTHFSLADHTTTGGRNLLMYGTLASSFTLTNGERIAVNTGALDIDAPTS